MKKIAILVILSFLTFSGFSQSSLNGLGVGFNYNGTGRIPTDLIRSYFADDIFRDLAADGYGNLNRVLSSYEFTIKPGQNDYLFIDLDVLQGAEFLYGGANSNYARGDTSFYSSVNLDLSSSVIGLKGMARFCTPAEKRFFYNFGIGVEALRTYNVSAQGYGYTSISSWQTGYYVTENEDLRNADAPGYTSLNVVQQVGAAFRLGKDETKFPLNKTYLELDFQINNNFTTMNDLLGKYRTYGFTLSMVYELGGNKS